MNITVNGESVVVRKDDELTVEQGYPYPHEERLGKLGDLCVNLVTGVGDIAGRKTLLVLEGSRGRYVQLTTDATIVVGDHRYPVAGLGSLEIGEPPVNEPPVDLTEALPDRIELGPYDKLIVERHVQGTYGIPGEPRVSVWHITEPVAFEVAAPPEAWEMLTISPPADVAAPAFVPAGRFGEA